LEQILYYLRVQGSISPSDKGWSVAETSPNFLPTDLRAILLSRLDQLQPEVKTLVQTASILGREFQFPLLREILGNDPALDSSLEAAQQSFLITQVSDHQYIFQSNLLRETAYQMQAIAQRRKMHASAVEALITLYQEDRSNVYP
jgi:predicted ATPase